LFEALGETEACLKLSQEEVRRIADYMQQSYFKHLRLYDFVLNNKQLCEVKRLTLHANEPTIAPTLGDALLLGAEEAIPYEDDLEVVRLDVLAQQEAIRAD
jgi:ATP phosphoribosyltransferase